MFNDTYESRLFDLVENLGIEPVDIDKAYKAHYKESWDPVNISLEDFIECLEVTRLGNGNWYRDRDIDRLSEILRGDNDV